MMNWLRVGLTSLCLSILSIGAQAGLPIQNSPPIVASVAELRNMSTSSFPAGTVITSAMGLSTPSYQFIAASGPCVLDNGITCVDSNDGNSWVGAGPLMRGPASSTVGHVALLGDTLGSIITDAGGPPLTGSSPVGVGLLAVSTSTTTYDWQVPNSVIPGTLVGLQIICADACGSDSPPIVGGGIVTVVPSCNTSTPCQFAPDSGTQSVILEGCGGGASGGGATASNSTTKGSMGSGGGAGAYFKMWVHATGAGMTLEVGLGGAAASAGSSGNAGGDTSIGGTFTGGGGAAGVAGGTSATTLVRPPSGLASVAYTSGWTLMVPISHESGGAGFYNVNGWSGAGGSSPMGTGGQSVFATASSTQSAGNAGTGFCAGGSGGASANNNSGSNEAGGPGANGILLMWEYSNL